MTARPLVLAIAAATGLGLGFASAAGASAESAQRAGVTVLPGLGGEVDMALAVNDAGVTVGYSLSPDGRYYAVRWSGGRIAKLPGLGGSECQARDIDNAGRIVGGCVTTAGQYKAVAWVDGALTRLPAPGGFSMAVATSAAGVVGTYNVPGSDPFATRRAFLWRPGKPVQTIAATPGASADGINDAGVVAGTLGWGYPDAAPLRSYRAWTWRAGTLTRLGSLGGGSTPNDINNAGQVVGTSFVTATRMDPYLFSAGRMTPLRTGGRTSVTAQAINDQGVVVGTDGDYQLAVRWASPTSVPVALPLPAGMTWSQGQDVNNAGLTVGSVSGEVTNPRRVIFKAAIWR